MGASRSIDRRVQRTRRALADALIELILKRGWEETTVQHVCDHANVGRSTFYVHFADKEDLLISGFDELRKALRARGAGPSNPRTLGFARGLIEHTYEHRRLFRAVVGRRSGQVVQNRFRQLLISLVEEDLAKLRPPGPRLDASANYLAGALFQLVIWWHETRNALEPDDVATIFDRLTAAVLSALPPS